MLNETLEKDSLTCASPPNKCSNESLKSSRSQIFVKIGVHKNCVNFTEKKSLLESLLQVCRPEGSNIGVFL